jgi:hypothetical protein
MPADPGHLPAATGDQLPEYGLPASDAVPADSAGLPAVPRDGRPAVLLMT